MRNVLSSSYSRVRMITLSLLMVLLFHVHELRAQEDFVFPCTSGLTHNFPEVIAGSALATITIEGIGAGTTSMSLEEVSYEDIFGQTIHCPGPACASPQTLFGITITNTGSTITVSGVPTASAAGKTIIFVVIATKNGEQCQRTFRLPIVRKPIDLVVVLDRSGSMDWGYDGTPGVGTPNRRWDGLMTGMGVLKTNLQGMGILKNGDMLGMRLFASGPNVVIPAAPFNAGLVPAVANAPSLSSVLSGVNPAGNTALGDGILAARDLLLPGTVGSNKTMIVFSDGVQNTGDQVKTSGSDQFTTTISNKKLSGPSNEIKIHTICLGSSGHNPSLMEGIANANGGLYKNTLAGAEADFTTFFAANLETILRGSSPQVIDITKGAFPGSVNDSPPAAQYSFFVDKGAASVVITVMTATRNEAHFIAITRDGTDMTQFVQMDRGFGYFSASFRLNNVPGQMLSGEWKIAIRLGTRPRVPTPYTIMVMADDHSVTPGYVTGNNKFEVSGTFNPKATLVSLGRSVNNATVQAIVLKPGDDLNDLLARANVTATEPPGDPGSPDVAKLAELMKDTAFLNKIKAKQQILNMSFNAGDSTYGASYNGLDVTGPYQVVYKITADHPTLGKIQRYAQESFYVRFADIDLNNSQLSVNNSSGVSVITFKPQASNGKLIGIGWGPTILVEAGGLLPTKVLDKGDGSYEVTLNGVLTGPVKISLAGEDVYNGNADGLACYGPNAGFWQKIKCWLMSLGLPAWMIWVALVLLLIIVWIIVRRLLK